VKDFTHMYRDHAVIFGDEFQCVNHYPVIRKFLGPFLAHGWVSDATILLRMHNDTPQDDGGSRKKTVKFGGTCNGSCIGYILVTK
jgi:hypothetical protein